VAVVIGEAAVAVRADPPDAGDVENQAGGPILDALSSVGGKGAALLGGILGGAALGAAFGSALEQEAMGDKLNAQLGASGQYAEDLGGIAGRLYADAYGENLGEVNEALRSVLQSGLLDEDAANAEIEAVTAHAMDLATAFDVDVAEAANAAGRMVQTGLAANAGEALDIVTRGFQQGADAGGDLLDVLGEYGTTFTELGLQGPQAVGLIDQALAAGIPNADFAADALREMGIIAREGGEEAATALGDLGLNAEEYFAAMQQGGPAASAALDTVLDSLRNTEDPALRSAAATALVGTQYEDLGDALLSMDPSEAAARLGTVEGAAASMGDTLNDNASTNLTSFMRGLQQVFVDLIGGQVIPIVSTVVGWLRDQFGPAVSAIGDFVSGTVVPALQAMATWLSENSTTIAIIAGVIAAVFLPHLIALGVQSTIAGAKAAAGWVMTQAGAIRAAAVHSVQVIRMVAGWVLLGAQAMLGAARIAAAWLIALGPVGLVIAAVVGLVTLIVVYFDEIVAAISAAWEWVKEAAQAAWDWIVGAVQGALDWLVDLFMNWTLIGLIIQHWDTIKQVFTDAIDAVVEFVTGLPQRLWDALVNLGTMLWDLATAAWEMFDSAVDTAVEAVVTYVTQLPGRFVSGLQNIGSMIAGVARSAWQWFKDTVVDRVGDLLRFVGSIPGKIVSGIGSLGRLLWNKGKELIQGLVDGIAAAASFVGNVAKNIVNGVIGFVNRNIIDGINDLLEFTIMGITINPPDIPHIPRLHEGGEFYSPEGEGLAILRSGELVVTAQQRRDAGFLSSLLNDATPGAAGAGAAAGAGVSITNNVTQQPGEDGSTLAARITQGTVWNLNVGITRRVGAGAEAFA
jgi:phage-related minor tail protein